MNQVHIWKVLLSILIWKELTKSILYKRSEAKEFKKWKTFMAH